MGKKNRLGEPKGPIITGPFSMETGKMYLIALVITFHILPLFFVILGENGVALMTNMFLFMLNPMFIFIISLLYGVRIGFNWKYTLIAVIIATASVPMYYSFETLGNVVISTIISLIVYYVFVVVSTAIGGFLKKYI
jgi:hypothetical protein